MGIEGRPTLRMLADDLTSGWSNAHHRRAVKAGLDKQLPPLEQMGHPLVIYFTNDWCGLDPSRRELIKGIDHSDGLSWKVKSGRWRGACWVDQRTGVAWLCAAGIRRAGGVSDFYAGFTTGVQGNPTAFLPNEFDRAQLRRERATDLLERWESSVSERVVKALGIAAESPSKESATIVNHPNGQPLLDIAVVVESADYVFEITLRTTPIDRKQTRHVERAELIMLAAVCPVEQSWDTSPAGDSTLYSVTTDRTGLTKMLAAATASAGTVRPSQPGSEAHYTVKEGLTDRTIQGQGVRALCGLWFVPRQDHAHRPVCHECSAVQASYPTG